MINGQMALSMDALRQGDRQELARLVDEYSNVVYRTAFRILGNQQDAEDVLQNTFLKVMKGLKDFEERSSLSTWIFRIAVNEALMMIRKHKPSLSIEESFTEDDFDSEVKPLDLTDWCCLPEEELLNKETILMLESALHKLNGKLRTVFILRDIEGFSIKETAEITDLSETAVKTRLLRARLRLREELGAFFHERLPARRIE